MPTEHPTLTDEQFEAFGARARRDPRSTSRRPRRARRRLHPQGDQGASAASRSPAAACSCSASCRPPGSPGPRALSRLEDPRQHGDRPQRDARPVRLDGATRASTPRMFEWDTACPGDQWRTPTTTCTTPTRTSSARTATSATASCACPRTRSGTRTTSATRSTRSLLMIFFQYGVALHDLEVERIVAGEVAARRQQGAARRDLAQGPQPGAQGLRAVPGAHRARCSRSTLAGNATANLVRNVWAFTIIFCGHFPDGRREFTEEETEDETRGQWYYRQLLGSANLTGGKLFHVMTGNLSHQIEHHLFPDIPAHRYAGDRGRGARDLRALRPPLQHRPAAQAVRLGRPQDLPSSRCPTGSGAAAPASRRSPPPCRSCPSRRLPRRPSRLPPSPRDSERIPAVGLSKAERRKDTVQVVVEAGATHAGRIAGIVAGAVRDVTREIGDFATEVFEIREASERAAADAGDYVDAEETAASPLTDARARAGGLAGRALSRRAGGSCCRGRARPLRTRRSRADLRRSRATPA